jgi:hypothetical protein
MQENSAKYARQGLPDFLIILASLVVVARPHLLQCRSWLVSNPETSLSNQRTFQLSHLSPERVSHSYKQLTENYLVNA